MGLQSAPNVESVNRCIMHMAARFRSQSPMPFEMFLLDAGDSYHHDLLTGMRGIRPGGADRATDELWLARHEEAFSGVGLQRPSRASLEQYASGGPVSCAAWFLQQPLRKQEVAFFAAVTCPPAGPEMAVDIGRDGRGCQGGRRQTWLRCNASVSDRRHCLCAPAAT